MNNQDYTLSWDPLTMALKTYLALKQGVTGSIPGNFGHDITNSDGGKTIF